MLSITHNSIKHQSFVYTQLNYQTVLFQTIQFSMSFVYTQLKCQTPIWLIDMTLSGATSPVQSLPGSDCNEEVLRIPWSSSITGVSWSDAWCLIQDIRWRRGGGLTPLQRSGQCIQQPQPIGMWGVFQMYWLWSCI